VALPNWICCQLGAREHYAIPRSLHQAGQLSQLITDAWVAPRSPLNALPASLLRSLSDRYHPDLLTAPVQAFTAEAIAFELRQRLQKTSDWERMINRNQWFQQNAIRQLERSHHPTNSTLFTYSYAALELLHYAKRKGWKTVLGQIDPGIIEEKIVQAEFAKHPDLAPNWQPVPPSYWDTWRKECQLADRILVNSAWSAKLLEQAGIDPNKLKIVPLVYEPSPLAQSFTRSYPAEFSQARPLKVLFLGQVTLRKGIAAILEAITLLKEQPIEFWFVGSQQIVIPPELINHSQVRWIGTVARSQVQDYYQQADVFLFPTLSDGFGLTQLEAQAWHLPIVVSQFCGEVVTNQINGVVLSEVTGKEIANVLTSFLAQPKTLTNLSKHSYLSEVLLAHLSQQLRTMGANSISKTRSINL
jgi:glycosyltransferase involved in cell wall biosynthesis